MRLAKRVRRFTPATFRQRGKRPSNPRPSASNHRFLPGIRGGCRVGRRPGIQSALLSYRLADAAAAGCDVAVITTQPGSRSHQNAQRRGFDLLYTRAVLVNHP